MTTMSTAAERGEKLAPKKETPKPAQPPTVITFRLERGEKLAPKKETPKPAQPPTVITFATAERGVLNSCGPFKLHRIDTWTGFAEVLAGTFDSVDLAIGHARSGKAGHGGFKVRPASAGSRPMIARDDTFDFESRGFVSVPLS